MNCDREGICKKEKPGCKVGCTYYIQTYDVSQEPYKVKRGFFSYKNDKKKEWERKKARDRRKKGYKDGD